MNRRTSFWLNWGVAILAIGGLTSTARAQDKPAEKPKEKVAEKANPAGTWKWSFTRQDGQAMEFSLKLKLDGEKLTGTYIGFQGQESKIEEGKFKDGELSFTVVREREGQKFSVNYRGKVAGETIKGQISGTFGGQDRTFDWEAKRAAERLNFAGTWKWSFTTQSGETRDSMLRLKVDGDKLTGTITGRSGQESPIEEVKVKGADLSFQVTREREGQKFIVKYQGTLSGDTIKGKSESEFGGQTRARDWEAKREAEKK